MFPFLSTLFVSCPVNFNHPKENMVHIDHEHDVKLIKFNKDQLSFRKIEKVSLPAEKNYSKGINGKFQVDLGMANVPVLDQGQEGTCVTFSSTAALNAIIGTGDFISQQCSLELDTALGEDHWDGAYYPSQIIDPLQQYGVVKKDACDNLYPVPYVSIDIDLYEQISDQDAGEKIAEVEYSYSPKASLAVVKKALNAGHRVLIGFQLQEIPQAVKGFDVKVDNKKYNGGLWACKQDGSSNYCANPSAGHEVVVIGYDDAQQLLKIRNSWSASMGNNGDYYMSYTYFQSMVVDQTEIW